MCVFNPHSSIQCTVLKLTDPHIITIESSFDSINCINNSLKSLKTNTQNYIISRACCPSLQFVAKREMSKAMREASFMILVSEKMALIQLTSNGTQTQLHRAGIRSNKLNWKFYLHKTCKNIFKSSCESKNLQV